MAQREAYDLDLTWTQDEDLADLVQDTIEGAMSNSERSRWAADHKLGVSDIGHCRRYVQLLLQQEPFSDEEPDRMAAFVGTAVGDLIEKNLPGDWVTQASVVVSIDVDTPGGTIRLNLPGHPDAYSTERDRLLDFKSKASLDVARRFPPTLQQKIQLTLYAKALIDLGKLTEDCLLSLVYVDRSATGGSRPVVYSWRYDPAALQVAQAWLADVFTATMDGTDAPCDKERDWCMNWCPFATTCRGHDTDAEGLLDPESSVAVDVYLEAAAEERAARKKKEQAASLLKGQSGFTPGGASVRTVEIGPTFVEEGWRKGYQRLSVSPGSSGRRKG